MVEHRKRQKGTTEQVRQQTQPYGPYLTSYIFKHNIQKTFYNIADITVPRPHFATSSVMPFFFFGLKL